MYSPIQIWMWWFTYLIMDNHALKTSIEISQIFTSDLSGKTGQCRALHVKSQAVYCVFVCFSAVRWVREQSFWGSRERRECPSWRENWRSSNHRLTQQKRWEYYYYGTFKAIVHCKIKVILQLTHPHAIPNDWLHSAERTNEFRIKWSSPKKHILYCAFIIKYCCYVCERKWLKGSFFSKITVLLLRVSWLVVTPDLSLKGEFTQK